MEQGGYAANGVKHCVRPVDMTGSLLLLPQLAPSPPTHKNHNVDLHLHAVCLLLMTLLTSGGYQPACCM